MLPNHTTVGHYVLRAARSSRHIALLAGVSAISLMVGAAPAQARGSLSPGSGFVPPVTSAMTSSIANAQQAAAVTQASQSSLSRATQALQAMQAVQSAARNLVLDAPSSVPDGLNNGGLVPDSGLASSGVAKPVTDWVGAQTPTQTTSGGQTTVTVQQTAAQAILSWNSFNIGKNTTLDFNQQGNTTWVALNRVSNSIAPSQILGNIQATGQVYVINNNGIIFGGSSQINVGALIASSANISDTQFLNNGINSPLNGPTYTPSFTNANAAITVDAGAQINVNGPTSVTSGGGFVLLMGTQVQNAGTITTPGGQTELAAGDSFLIRPGQSTSGNETSTTVGNEIAVQLKTPGSSLTGGSGLVSNTGLIEATTGDITLVGETVNQAGVAISSTSVDTRGTIHLLSSASDPFASVTLTPDSLTAIIPDMNGATALNSQRTSLLAGSATENAARAGAFNAQFDDLSQLADDEAESRVEIVSGNTVEFQGNSTVLANGGQVAVSAVNRVQVDTAADIDVSGIQTSLPMSANELSVNVQGSELADDPNNRVTNDLNNGNVFVDINGLVEVPAGTGGDASARDYTPGGLLEVSGELSDVDHTIGEWLATGGEITFSTGTQTGAQMTAGGSVVAQPGSLFNISGGAIQYQGGELQQSYVETAEGQIFNVNTAPAGLDYTSVYDGFVENHPTWGVSETFDDSLHTPSEVFEPSFTVGRDAGSLTLSTPTAVFEGTIDAGVIDGTGQTQAQVAGDDVESIATTVDGAQQSLTVTDPYLLAQDVVPLAGSLIIGDYNAQGLAGVFDTDVVFADDLVPAAGNISVNTPITTVLNDTALLDASQIDTEGLGGLFVATGNDIQVNAPLILTPGAQVNFIAPTTEIIASLTANGGSVSISDLLPALIQPGSDDTSPPTLLTDADGSTSVTVEGSIDTSGLFTNALLDPADQTDEAFTNGGDVSISSEQGITLAAGSLVDASSGGAVLSTGKTQGGTGGNITVTADAQFQSDAAGASPLVLDGTLRSIGVTAGGELTLQALSVLIGDNVTGASATTLVLPTSFFTQGFSNYNITGHNGLSVAPGAQVNVTEPVDQFVAASFSAPTGSDPASVLQASLLPVFTQNPQTDTLTQRAGASLTLNANDGSDISTGGPLTIGAGALLAVDPGQSITLSADQQITVDGTLRAAGGDINVVNNGPLGGTFNATTVAPSGLSIWIGGDATLDVAGEAATAVDSEGRTYGMVTPGGEITLGSEQPVVSSSGAFQSSNAFIIIRPGAVLNASGANALILPNTGTGASSNLTIGDTRPVEVASNGGAITLTSFEGIYAEGTLMAAGGGVGAAGGTLSIALLDPALNPFTVVNEQPIAVSDADRVPAVITISQADNDALLPASLQPGQTDAALNIGQAQFSANNIEEGGFDNLDFTASDAILFNGNVNLAAGQSITFNQGPLSDTTTTGHVAISAPYVLLDGFTGAGLVGAQFSADIAVDNSLSNQVSTGVLTVNADLIDFQNTVSFGLSGTEALLNGASKNYDFAGFGNVNFVSQGDIRFLQNDEVGGAINTGIAGLPSLGATSVESTGNLSFMAAQLYPETGAVAKISAGLVGGSEQNGALSPNGVIDISKISDTDPALPSSVFGSISFAANIINQGGVVRAPLGDIVFGEAGVDGTTASVNILAGSETSVSAAGLTVPFGGTTDGVTYTQDGNTITGAAPGTIELEGQSFDVAQGALLDLTGGGTLAGAGFVAGSGGSVDVLTTPLVKSNPTNTFSAANGQVYAIIPGFSGYAPVAAGEGAAPGIGQQITIPSGVPGLPAGTYTLLPADYALQPGGFRVELGKTGGAADNGVAVTGDGSYLLDGYEGTANTKIINTVATQVIVTPGATVLNYSQYNQTSLSDFLVANAANLDQLPPAVPANAGTLELLYAATGTLPALSFQGTALFSAAAGGIAGTAEITTEGEEALEIFGSAPTPGFSGASVNGGDLNAIHAPSLVIGGGQDAGDASFSAQAENVTVDNGVILSAPQVVLTALNDVTLDPGAEIDTLGEGAAPNVAANFFDAGGEVGGTVHQSTTLVVSNNDLNFIGGSDSPGAITIGAGASVFSDGTIAFLTSGQVTIDPTARYGTANLVLGVGTLNIGTEAGAVVPQGVLLTQATLDALLAGDTTEGGAPALQSFVLTASQSVNIYGSINLDFSGATTGEADVELVVNTPAIYGFGSAADSATLTVGTLVWNGIPVTTAIGEGGSITTYQSAPPGGVVAGGPGTGSGSFTIDANEVIFGNAANAVPNDQVTLDRLMLGFSNVNINAATEITDNTKGTLSVYQVGNPTGTGGGTGGNLTLSTPLLTGGAGSVMGFTAGGALNVVQPAGTAASPPTFQALGAEIDLTGNTILVDSPVVLASGKLTMTASGDIVLGASSDLDLAGAMVPLFDQTSYTPGGTVNLQSSNGDITQASGAAIDVSAVDNNAGSITVEATGADAGQVALDGTLLGATSLSSGSTGNFNGGSFSVAAQALGNGTTGLTNDFANLNTTLNAGGFSLLRSFDFKQGDLTIGNGVQAQAVNVSVDGGSLVVDGLIDASGAAPGSISLAAQNDLTLAAGAVLDAQGNVLQADSYGQAIDAENKATVNLTATQGMLTLASGATIDVSSPDPNPQGDVELNVARTGETSGEANISAAGPLNISGAATIAVNAFWNYSPTDPNGTIVQDNGSTSTVGTTGADAGFVGLDQINTQSVAFINAALTNSSFRGQLAGFTAFSDAFHLRPGVDIESATPDGNLTVAGDLDLSSFRYASLNLNPNSQPTTVVGSVEPMDLVIRAGGNLTIGGSISDGFAPPPKTPDDNGWVIVTGQNTPADVIVDTSVTLASGTTFSPHATSLGYSIRISATTVDANTVFPLSLTTSSKVTLASTITTTAEITEPGGIVIPAGTVLTDGTVIPLNSVLGVGTVLPETVSIGATTIPAGTSLNAFAAIRLASNTTILPGNVIPEGTNVKAAGNASTLAIRATGTDGAEGALYAVAPLLPSGELSSSISLISGADLSAADTGTVQSPGALAASGTDGNLILSDTHYNETRTAADPSVIRTGTGDLSLSVGGSLDEETLYGIYTAGTQSPMTDVSVTNPLAGIKNPETGVTQPAMVNEFDLPLGLNADGSDTVLGSGNGDYEAASKGYQAYYPENGGNLTVTVQGNLSGNYIPAANPGTATGPNEDSNAIGNWLFRQGGSSTGQATAWWINYGTFSTQIGGSDRPAPYVSAFTGFGTLGGGNLAIDVGGNAGTSTSDPNGAISATVASTGRVLPNGTLAQTGGGDLTINVGGVLNSSTTVNQTTDDDSGGIFSDLRGNITIAAQAVGDIELSYGPGTNDFDPRSTSPLTATGGIPLGGIVVAPGDGAVNITARGDLVLAGVQDAGRVNSLQNLTPFTNTSNGTVKNYFGGGDASFTLWTNSTNINLFSVGGNITPNGAYSDSTTDVQDFFPSTLNVIADSGNIDLVRVENISDSTAGAVPLELAPSPDGQLTLLAADSIFGNAAVVDISGANPSIEATPFDPSFTSSTAFGNITNISPDSIGSLLPFGPDTPTTDLHQNDPDPALIYAVSGDITELTFGQVINFGSASNISTKTWYIGAKAAEIKAGGDIVSSGDPYSTNNFPGNPNNLGEFTSFGIGGLLNTGARSTGNFILNANPNDVSVVSAGQDIIYSSFQVGGPGLLDVSAGRNFYAGGQGTLVSLGPVFGVNQSNTDSGAGITLMAGVGATGPDYAAFANLYFNPANQANLAVPLDDQPGTVIATYNDQLFAWLQSRFGYAGTQANALDYFLSLPTEQQGVFVRQVYFGELNQSGLDFNSPSAIDFKSYSRGQQAIATLFPDQTTTGQPIAYSGSITMFSADVSLDGKTGHIELTSSGKGKVQSDSGIHTNFGGAIQTLTPGGETLIGENGGLVPGASAGILTEGSGDIDMYSLQSILLGQSRILTTFGGNIVAWSAEGDINAGEGAKTTVVPTPPELAYDNYGNITLAPQVPSTGAGIGTLSPIPEVPPGNINLVTPLGTVNAGEAGIRVSGNLNIAALHIVNAANIQVKGTSTGIPTAVAPNIGALTTAGNAAGAAVNTAANAGKHTANSDQPSIIIIEILGYGGANGTTNDQQQQDKRKKMNTQASYNPASMFRVIGNGNLTSAQRNELTTEERGNLRE